MFAEDRGRGWRGGGRRNALCGVWDWCLSCWIDIYVYIYVIYMSYMYAYTMHSRVLSGDVCAWSSENRTGMTRGCCVQWSRRCVMMLDWTWMLRIVSAALVEHHKLLTSWEHLVLMPSYLLSLSLVRPRVCCRNDGEPKADCFKIQNRIVFVKPLSNNAR